MFDEQVVVSFFSVLTLIGNIALVVLLIAMVVVGRGKNKLFEKLLKFVDKWAFQFSLLISFSATLGSLLFSEVLLYEPCKLCWFQRIFMYPLVPMLALAIGNKDKKIAEYVLVLSSVGAMIATYHLALQFNPGLPTTCGVVGMSASCTTDFFKAFGYVTIPMMSLSAFLLIIVSMLVTMIFPSQKSILNKIKEKISKK